MKASRREQKLYKVQGLRARVKVNSLLPQLYMVVVKNGSHKLRHDGLTRGEQSKKWKCHSGPLCNVTQDAWRGTLHTHNSQKCWCLHRPCVRMQGWRFSPKSIKRVLEGWRPPHRNSQSSKDLRAAIKTIQMKLQPKCMWVTLSRKPWSHRLQILLIGVEHCLRGTAIGGVSRGPVKLSLMKPHDVLGASLR
jgi:hypothetical protein